MSAADQSAAGFRCVQQPTLSLEAYAARLRKLFHCSSECFVICAAYLDRFDRRHPGITGPLTCHRLLLVSLALAAKFHDDTHYVNSFYAKVGGLSLQELNALELLMLRLLDFRLHVTPEEFEAYRCLLGRAAESEATSAGDVP
mmetsp:Transcript_59504/g.153777  ORF Transcript_59504/g.153777 Transcript_59504/m.153777 type:complete len:143 (-) Transcript_59504:399-827(-)